MKVEYITNKHQEQFIKLQFGETLEILRFQQQLQELVNCCSPDLASQLAAYIIARLLRSKNLFFAYPKPKTSLKIDRETALAIYVLAERATGYDFAKVRNTIHQYLIA
jgi:hypothetical protein